MVFAIISVNNPLNTEAAVKSNHIPFSPKVGARIKRRTAGNTRVPERETINERIGRPSAVKYEEKHISTHPAR